MREELFEKLKPEISSKGYFSKKRKGVVGEPLAVGQKAEKSEGTQIEVIQRLFYILPRDDGSWYTLVGGIDTNEELSF